MKHSLQSDLQASHEKSLTDLMCQNQSIRWLGIGEKDFTGIALAIFNRAQVSRLNQSSTYLPDNDMLMIENQVRKSTEDENDIIKKLTNLIMETDEVSTDITVDKQDKIKKKVINDYHLFHSTKLCPLCYLSCDQPFSEEEGPERIHCSRHHRPQDTAVYVRKQNKEFVTPFCNDLIKSNHTFRIILRII